MKKLICAKDVEDFAKSNEKVFYIDEKTILTPSAKDIAKALDITFSTDKPKIVETPVVESCTKENVIESCTKEKEVNLDVDMIYKVLKALADKGLMQGILDCVAEKKPYAFEKDSCGLKIVRGSNMQYEPLDTGNPHDKVFYQEIINKDDGCSMNAGFITIENCRFDWECACEEIYHIIEGTLTVSVDDKVYTAQAGDSVFFPNGAKVAFGSPNKMKAFYATY